METAGLCSLTGAPRTRRVPTSTAHRVGTGHDEPRRSAPAGAVVVVEVNARRFSTCPIGFSRPHGRGLGAARIPCLRAGNPANRSRLTRRGPCRTLRGCRARDRSGQMRIAPGAAEALAQHVVRIGGEASAEPRRRQYPSRSTATPATPQGRVPAVFDLRPRSGQRARRSVELIPGVRQNRAAWPKRVGGRIEDGSRHGRQVRGSRGARCLRATRSAVVAFDSKAGDRRTDSPPAGTMRTLRSASPACARGLDGHHSRVGGGLSTVPRRGSASRRTPPLS
jgi:hypothetical protein